MGCPSGDLLLLDFGLLPARSGTGVGGEQVGGTGVGGTGELDRIRRLLADRRAGAAVPFLGASAVAVGGVPTGRALPVRGRRMDPGGLDADRWSEVWVELDPREPAGSSGVGTVRVDDLGAMEAGLAEEARLVFADAGSVGSWARDGLDDLVFPGPATIGVGGADVTGFATTWGEGTYDVHADLAADGSVCRLRVTLGGPDVVRRARERDQARFGGLAKAAIASARVAVDGCPAAWLYREPPGHRDDSGWRLLAGDETEAYLDDPANAVIVRLRDLVTADPALGPVLATPAPAAFARHPDGAFRRADPPG